VAAFNFSCFERGKVFAVAFLQFENAGYLVRDAESAYLDLIQDEEDAMGAIVGATITYRLAFGQRLTSMAKSPKFRSSTCV